MGKIAGSVTVTGLMAPSDSTDTYAITDATYGIDGLRNVTDKNIRNAIPADRRRAGMVVGTQDDGQYWSLKKIIGDNWAYDDTDWEGFGSNFAHNALPDLQGGLIDSKYHSDQPINTTDDVLFNSLTSTEQIQIGNFISGTPGAGMLAWNGSNFIGYNGSEWYNVDGTASGENYSIQFNNSNAFGGSSNFKFGPNDALTLGTRTNTNGINSVVIGTDNDGSGLNAFSVGSNNIADQKFAVTFGESLEATGEYSFAIGYKTIASGNYSVSGGSSTHPSKKVTAAGSNSFNFSTITETFVENGVDADNSAILAGVNNSIQSGISNSAVIGGIGINGTENNTVYVPNLVSKGHIRVDDTTDTTTGNIRYNTTDFRFEGYDGSTWKRFDLTNHNELLSIEGGDANHKYHSDQPINTTDDVIFNKLHATKFITSGTDTIAHDFCIVALGNRASAAQSAAAIGQDSLTLVGGVAIGEFARGKEYGVTLGFHAVSTGQNGIAIGRYSLADGLSTIAIGRDVTATNDYTIAIGETNTANESKSIIIGYSNTTNNIGAITLGTNSVINGIDSINIGNNNATTASSIIIGNYGSTQNKASILGNGISQANPMVNTIDNSIAIGTSSDTPSIWVHGGDNTIGSFGGLSIGTSSISPNSMLKIKSKTTNVNIVEINDNTDTNIVYIDNRGLVKSNFIKLDQTIESDMPTPDPGTIRYKDGAFWGYAVDTWVNLNNAGAAAGGTDAVKKVFTINGDDATTIFTLSHDLNTVDVNTSVYDKDTSFDVIVNIKRASVNTIEVHFNNPPAAGKSYGVTVIG